MNTSQNDATDQDTIHTIYEKRRVKLVTCPQALERLFQQLVGKLRTTAAAASDGVVPSCQPSSSNTRSELLGLAAMLQSALRAATYGTAVLHRPAPAPMQPQVQPGTSDPYVWFAFTKASLPFHSQMEGRSKDMSCGKQNIGTERLRPQVSPFPRIPAQQLGQAPHMCFKCEGGTDNAAGLLCLFAQAG